MADLTDDPQPGAAAAAAKAEAGRQAVMLAGMVIAIPVLAWLERKASSPDAVRELRMRAARQLERQAARLAAWCWQRAEQARKVYDTKAA